MISSFAPAFRALASPQAGIHACAAVAVLGQRALSTVAAVRPDRTGVLGTFAYDSNSTKVAMGDGGHEPTTYQHKIEFRVLDGTLAEAAAASMEAGLTTEPAIAALAKAKNISAADMAADIRKWSQAIIGDMTKSGLSIVAVDVSDASKETIAATVFLRDFFQGHSIEQRESIKGTSLRPLFVWRHGLYVKYMKSNPLVDGTSDYDKAQASSRRGDVANVYMGSTLPAYRHHNLFRTCLELAEQQANRAGYSRLVTAVSGNEEQYTALRDLKMKPVVTLPWNEPLPGYKGDANFEKFGSGEKSSFTMLQKWIK